MPTIDGDAGKALLIAPLVLLAVLTVVALLLDLSACRHAYATLDADTRLPRLLRHNFANVVWYPDLLGEAGQREWKRAAAWRAVAFLSMAAAMVYISAVRSLR